MPLARIVPVLLVALDFQVNKEESLSVGATAENSIWTVRNLKEQTICRLLDVIVSLPDPSA